MSGNNQHSIEIDDAQRITMYPDRANRQLGIGDFYEIDEITDEHVLFHTSEMLLGNRLVPDVTRASLDPVSRALLKHEGANPDAVEALISAARGLGFHDKDNERWALFGVDINEDAQEHNILESRIDSGSLTWIANQNGWTLQVGNIPETLRIAAVGRPLRDIVSHPALDVLPLMITGSAGKALAISMKPL